MRARPGIDVQTDVTYLRDMIRGMYWKVKKNLFEMGMDSKENLESLLGFLDGKVANAEMMRVYNHKPPTVPRVNAKRTGTSGTQPLPHLHQDLLLHLHPTKVPQNASGAQGACFSWSGKGKCLQGNNCQFAHNRPVREQF